MYLKIFSNAVSYNHTHTHTQARAHARKYARSLARTHARTHTHTHTHTRQLLSLLEHHVDDETARRVSSYARYCHNRVLCFPSNLVLQLTGFVAVLLVFQITLITAYHCT